MSVFDKTVPKEQRLYWRVQDEDRQQQEMEEFERILRKNKGGNYGLFAEKCDHCIDGPAGGSMLSSESSKMSFTLEKPNERKTRNTGSDYRETVS